MIYLFVICSNDISIWQVFNWYVCKSDVEIIYLFDRCSNDISIYLSGVQIIYLFVICSNDVYICQVFKWFISIWQVFHWYAYLSGVQMIYLLYDISIWQIFKWYIYLSGVQVIYLFVRCSNDLTEAVCLTKSVLTQLAILASVKVSADTKVIYF